MEGARLELGNGAQPSCRTRGEGLLWGFLFITLEEYIAVWFPLMDLMCCIFFFF